MEIQANNRIIAEFMGSEYNSEKKLFYKGGMFCNTFPNGNHYAKIEQLKYRSSWDWIVPVVQKIILINFPNTPENNSALYPVFKAWELISLHQIWESVVQFIQWHNTQTKKK